MRCRVLVLACLIAVMLPWTGKTQNVPDGDLSVPPEGYTQIIETTDGSSMVGRILSVTPQTVEFESSLGVLTISRDRIVRIRTVPSTTVQGGSYRFPDPNATRLYFAPTGRMLPKGNGYAADYYLFFPSFNYGITSHISLGGGFSIFPTGNMADQIYFFTPKIGIKETDKLNIAAGALVIHIPDFDDDDDGEEDDSDDIESPLLSVLYTSATWGSPDRSLTAAFGYGMVDTKFADRPMIVLGGEQRLTRRIAFVTENWMVPGVNEILVSYGLRFLSEKLTTDFAFLNVSGSGAVFPGIPYIDFVYNF
jgi:hypothetical protein